MPISRYLLSNCDRIAETYKSALVKSKLEYQISISNLVGPMPKNLILTFERKSNFSFYDHSAHSFQTLMVLRLHQRVKY